MQNEVHFLIDEIVEELRKLLPEAEVYSRMVRYDGEHAVIFEVYKDEEKYGNRYKLSKINMSSYKKIALNFYNHIKNYSKEGLL